ncbi:MAG TPA: tetratricopeptide repeat protein [Candidatus Saccharimonadia bacterium]|nr:tetratricopeptide repeat protein [Candidatus Saccharimonadia bacterium]
MTFRSRLTGAIAVLLLSLSALAAEPLAKAVPHPDVSKLQPGAKTEVTEMRRLFEEARPDLGGQALADAYAKLSAVYARHGLYDAARISLENAIALSPSDGRYPYLLGVYAQQQGQAAQARTHLARALQLDQTYLPIRYRLADVQFRANDLAGARATLEPLARSRPDLAPAPALLGQIALREKRYPDAIRLLEQALKADPGATSLHEPLAEAYRAAGQAANAAAARAKIGPGIAAFGDPLVQGVYATGASEPASVALALAASGKHPDARKLLDEALAQRANDPALLAAYARIEADSGNTAAARARADAAVAADAASADAKLAQGIVAELAGQEPQAVTYYEQAVRANLADPETRLLLGNAYMRAKRYPAAAEQYRALVAASPGDSGAWSRLAAAESAAGRCSNALASVNSALARRAQDGNLQQVFVRLASTCSGAAPTDRTRAIEVAKRLYAQLPGADHAEAYALALAANGKAKEAVEYQAQALFEAARRNDQAAATRGQTYMKLFEAGRAATQPWPQGHPLYVPPRLAPSVKRAAR